MLSWQYHFHLSDAAISGLLAAFLNMLNVIVKSKLMSSMLECLPKTVNKMSDLAWYRKKVQKFCLLC